MVHELLREYLVHVSVQRLAAYRQYREETFEYVTARKLEAWHWEALYAMVTADTLAATPRHAHLVQRRAYLEQCRSQRTQLCDAVGIAEERVPLEALTEFCKRHLCHAKLRV